MRREIPRKVVEGERKRYGEVEAQDESWIEGLGEGEKGSGVELGELERQSEVEGRWDGGVKGLERMVGSLPESVAKKERAEKVEAYVVSGDRR